MTGKEYYDSIRLRDLIAAVQNIYPNDKITADFPIKNATLKSIATSSAATNRILTWCKKKEAAC